MVRFVHLHTHSHWSLLDGVASPEDLAAKAAELGQHALALTDHGNLYGACKFQVACKEHGIKPIYGCEFYLCENASEKSQKRWHVTVLARNAIGWKNLITLSTASFRAPNFYYMPRIDLKTLVHHQDGLVVLSGCLNGQIAQRLLGSYSESVELAKFWNDSIERFYLEISALEKSESTERYLDIVQISEELDIPLVITGDVHYLKAEDAEYHEYLTKIRGKGKWSWRNDEIWLKSADEIWDTFVRHWSGSGLGKQTILDAMEKTAMIADEVENFSIEPEHDISQILIRK